MSNEEIIEGNKLICEFACIKNEDGTIYSNTQGGYPKGTMHFNLSNCPINTIYPFNHEHHYWYSGEWERNWSWIMPVVEKIEKLFQTELEGEVVITSNNCSIYTLKDDNYDFMSDDIEIPENTPKIQAIWLSVVNFIKWYNENKKE